MTWNIGIFPLHKKMSPTQSCHVIGMNAHAKLGTIYPLNSQQIVTFVRIIPRGKNGIINETILSEKDGIIIFMSV